MSRPTGTGDVGEPGEAAGAESGEVATPRVGPLERLSERVPAKWLLVVPAVAYAALLVIVPLIDLVRLALTSGYQGSFVGLAQFEQLLTSASFWGVLQNTLVFVVPSTAIELVLGVGLALAFYRDFPLKRHVQTLFLLPMVLTPFAVGLMFRWFFDSSLGIVNYLTTQVGLGSHVWLGDPQLAMGAVILADVWQWTPFVFLLSYATIKSVPESLVEAAKIDGAGRWQRFRHVLLPHLYPVLLITALIKLVIAFKTSDKIFAMTNGGPGSATKTLTMHIYEITFQFGDFSRGAAASIVFLIIILAIGNVFVALLSRAKREV